MKIEWMCGIYKKFTSIQASLRNINNLKHRHKHKGHIVKDVDHLKYLFYTFHTLELTFHCYSLCQCGLKSGEHDPSFLSQSVQPHGSKQKWDADLCTVKVPTSCYGFVNFDGFGQEASRKVPVRTQPFMSLQDWDDFRNSDT